MLKGVRYLDFIKVKLKILKIFLNYNNNEWMGPNAVMTKYETGQTENGMNCVEFNYVFAVLVVSCCC